MKKGARKLVRSASRLTRRITRRDAGRARSGIDEDVLGMPQGAVGGPLESYAHDSNVSDDGSGDLGRVSHKREGIFLEAYPRELTKDVIDSFVRRHQHSGFPMKLSIQISRAEDILELRTLIRDGWLDHFAQVVFAIVPDWRGLSSEHRRVVDEVLARDFEAGLGMVNDGDVATPLYRRQTTANLNEIERSAMQEYHRQERRALVTPNAPGSRHREVFYDFMSFLKRGGRDRLVLGCIDPVAMNDVLFSGIFFDGVPVGPSLLPSIRISLYLQPLYSSHHLVAPQYYLRALDASVASNPFLDEQDGIVDSLRCRNGVATSMLANDFIHAVSCTGLLVALDLDDQLYNHYNTGPDLLYRFSPHTSDVVDLRMRDTAGSFLQEHYNSVWGAIGFSDTIGRLVSSSTRSINFDGSVLNSASEGHSGNQGVLLGAQVRFLRDIQRMLSRIPPTDGQRVRVNFGDVNLSPVLLNVARECGFPHIATGLVSFDPTSRADSSNAQYTDAPPEYSARLPHGPPVLPAYTELPFPYTEFSTGDVFYLDDIAPALLSRAQIDQGGSSGLSAPSALSNNGLGAVTTRSDSSDYVEPMYAGLNSTDRDAEEPIYESVYSGSTRTDRDESDLDEADIAVDDNVSHILLPPEQFRDNDLLSNDDVSRATGNWFVHDGSDLVDVVDEPSVHDDAARAEAGDNSPVRRGSLRDREGGRRSSSSSGLEITRL